MTGCNRLPLPTSSISLTRNLCILESRKLKRYSDLFRAGGEHAHPLEQFSAHAHLIGCKISSLALAAGLTYAHTFDDIKGVRKNSGISF